MSVRVARKGRQRSSTGASAGLKPDEVDSDTAILIHQLAFSDDAISAAALRLSDIAAKLREQLRRNASSDKDTFRHGSGFEALLACLQHIISRVTNDKIALSAHAQLVKALLILLSEGLKDQRGNQKYFSSYLKGWQSLEKFVNDYLAVLFSFEDVHSSASSVLSLFEALFALALCDDDALVLSGKAAEGGDDMQSFKLSDMKDNILHNPQACSIALRHTLYCLDGKRGNAAANHLQSISRILKYTDVIIELSARNKVALWQTGVLHILLPFVLSDNEPAQWTTSLRDLTLHLADLGVDALEDVAVLFERACSSDPARDLLLDILQRSKRPPFIQFDLSYCGYSSIEVRSLPRAFPPMIGYSLTAWFQIDQFDPESHTTLFGAFDADQTCFVMLYLERDSHQLILQTSVRSARPSVRFKLKRFQAGRWYNLALVHRKYAADPRQSDAFLFIDGEFTEKVKCGYPEEPSHVEDRFSRPGSAPVRMAKKVQAFFGTPSDLSSHSERNQVKQQWSLAGAHLYQTPLSDEFVTVHHRLGPRYSGNMQDCLGPLLTYRASAELSRYNDLLHPDKAESEKSEIVTLTQNRGSEVVPENRLLLSISPTAVISFDNPHNSELSSTYELDHKALSKYHQLRRTCRAIAMNGAVSSINEAMTRSFGVGVLTGDPVVVIPKPLDDASWCLSGCVPALVRISESANTKAAFLKAVEIFFQCVRDNWRISEAMEKSNGFNMLALIIREKLGFESGTSGHASTRKPASMLGMEDRQSLSFELLHLILEFVGYNKTRTEDSMIVNPMGYRVLLVDFDTWRRCDFETQKLYYEQFVNFISHNRHNSFNLKRLTRMRVVKKFIDAFKSEDITTDSVDSLLKALNVLLDHSGGYTMYRDVAMFVAYGLQDEQNSASRPLQNMASIVNMRQRTLAWARAARGSRPTTPAGPTPPSRHCANKPELAIRVLDLLVELLCDHRSVISIRRFCDPKRGVPNRWLLHLLAESDVRVIGPTLRIIGRAMAVLKNDFKTSFADKNGGFLTMKNRMKHFWKVGSVWLACFAIMFGQEVPETNPAANFTLFSLMEALRVDDQLVVANPETFPIIMAMLETGLRSIIKTDDPTESEVHLLKTIIQFLSELYVRSIGFRDFATNSRYVQELLFVLYPVLVGSDRLSAETELQADKELLSFKGEEVKMRPHSNSLGGRPPSVRSLNIEDGRRTPSPMKRMPIQGPRRLSSFVLINPACSKPPASPAQFTSVLAPTTRDPVKMKVGNTIVESLLEVPINLFIDLICSKDKFQGIGLFMKVPPGFREHQAYFESYVLVNTLSQLWSHLQLNQDLVVEPRILGNLSRYAQHMTEALFEGWFIDGAQPVLDFTGKVLEYLQQPDIAAVNHVRLCNNHISAIRVVFLRVTLWRLSELDESAQESEVVAFLDQMNYWQTILFSSENQETLFIRLICFLLYIKLVSDARSVRLAAARLWRTILVQKPTESATLLTYAMGPEQRHLSTGFMKLVSMDDEDFISWVDENRESLDSVFIDALNKPWDDFVNDENRRNEDTAKSRLSKRKEKLRLWQAEESSADDFFHRYEISTTHWRSNVQAQEYGKLQRAFQDHQENVNSLLATFLRMEKKMQQPCGLTPSKNIPKWQLDETEAANRMRMRITPDTSDQNDVYQPKRKASVKAPNGKLSINTQMIHLSVSDNIMSSFPNSPSAHPPTPGAVDITQEQGESDKAKTDSASNSQLLEGAFEMIDRDDDDDGIIEDKNRKILTSLQRGDVAQQLYNISRIVGLEACEGLILVGKKCLYLQDNFFQRSDGEIVSASHAPEHERDPYVQLISGKDVGSSRTKHSAGDQETRHWTWMEVLSISKRRFLLRDVSVEVFFADGRSYLLTCMHPKARDELYNAILTRAPHVHSTSAVASEDAWRLDTLRNPEEAPQSLGSKFASVFNAAPSHAATKKWFKGEMSNFQYLMLVNTMAGRTFNDLTQYPVFPWVLADYTSQELDLDNPRTFRDLSKPMGCQTPAREAEYRDRFKQFAEMGDQNAPPFHFGTHYSSAMIVSSYLIRLQPFVQSYLLLQGGSFDHADRLFDSIERAWLSASRETMSDVRELTPEFFYLPEFLVNINQYDFGMKQSDGATVSDVHLPPWAKGDPQIFIAKHREALESPYVSEHLHEWIDLVFGFKQRGEAAVEAANVFQHLSYHGAKDLDNIDDPVERLATIGIIHSFGQTPHQIFHRPHPAKELSRSAVVRLDRAAESLIRLPEPLFESDERVTGLTFSPTQERLLCAGPSKLNILPNCDRFLQWGFADHSLRFFSSNTKRLLGLFENVHVGAIATATFVDSKTLVTSGHDCTIGLWTLSTTRDHIDIQSKSFLFGHRTPVTVLTASRVVSTLLSASTDGHVLLWGLNRLNCIRVLQPQGSLPIQAAKISNVSGHIALCQGVNLLLYTLNGHLLVKQKLCDNADDQILSCAFYEGAGNEWLERELIFTGHRGGVANVWSLTSLSDGSWHLQLVTRLNHADFSREDGGNSEAGITAILPMPQAVYTGDEKGRVWEWDCVQKHMSLNPGILKMTAMILSKR
ncbi:beige protein like 1 [Acrodontium crateriforme]|uniref:Beige protein like 1 n=1 Tax=Acrodontium crateriforme TaxID=150365 RepID=A0AAQ3M8B6_9PEZI|nr:beige protein like 1 [Acrodontium crateriforme]